MCSVGLVCILDMWQVEYVVVYVEAYRCFKIVVNFTWIKIILEEYYIIDNKKTELVPAT